MVPGEVPRGAAGPALRKAILGLLALAGAILVAFCALPLGHRQPVQGRETSVSGGGPLRAGAARVRIALPERPVLAGYSGHRRARAADEAVYARAIAVEAGGARAVVAAIETLLIPPRFGRLDGCALVAATHTHSGPGGLWDGFAAGWLGAGAFDAAQRDAVEAALQGAVRQAIAALGPAELQTVRADWPAGPARARSAGPVDAGLVALRLRRPSGEAIATLVDYAMHPTSAPRDTLSADWPGAVSALLESSTGAPALVVQGAVGNTTWDRSGPLAPPIVQEVEKLLSGAPWATGGTVECQERSVAPPLPEASPRVPWFLRRAVANGLGLAFDVDAVLVRLRIGDLTLLGIPGEPVGELGLAARPAVLVGLAGGYLGYVEKSERWHAGAGESPKTYFGPDLARTLELAPR